MWHALAATPRALADANGRATATHTPTHGTHGIYVAMPADYPHAPKYHACILGEDASAAPRAPANQQPLESIQLRAEWRNAFSPSRMSEQRRAHSINHSITEGMMMHTSVPSTDLTHRTLNQQCRHTHRLHFSSSRHAHHNGHGPRSRRPAPCGQHEQRRRRRRRAADSAGAAAAAVVDAQRWRRRTEPGLDGRRGASALVRVRVFLYYGGNATPSSESIDRSHPSTAGPTLKPLSNTPTPTPIKTAAAPVAGGVARGEEAEPPRGAGLRGLRLLGLQLQHPQAQGGGWTLARLMPMPPHGSVDRLTGCVVDPSLD